MLAWARQPHTALRMETPHNTCVHHLIQGCYHECRTLALHCALHHTLVKECLLAASPEILVWYCTPFDTALLYSANICHYISLHRKGISD